MAVSEDIANMRERLARIEESVSNIISKDIIAVKERLNDVIEVREKLVKIEQSILGIISTLDDRKECDKEINAKIDKILSNDKDKLQRITAAEQNIKSLKSTIKNFRATLFVFLVPIGASIVRSFI